MAADANRLAAALAYEDDRRRRLAESIPALTGPTTALRRNVRTDLENLSAGLGQGIVNQFEGVKGLITDPVGTAKGAYEAVRGIVRDPKVLAQALAETGRKAMSGPLGAGEVVGEMLGPMRGKPVMAEIDVYHGSPHRFEEFDASKIGTGEGAQAYGHGIYFAENPEVARGYKKDLSGFDEPFLQFGKTKIAGQQLSDIDLETFKFLEKGKRNAGQFPHNTVYYAKQAAKDNPAVLARLEEMGRDVKFGFEKNRGNLYTADLPDEMVDRMLDWDKPLSEQSPAIQDLARKIGAGKAAGPTKAKMKAFIEGKENAERGIVAKGEDLYRALSDYGGQSVEGSRALQSVGIPGIRYLDAGSRGQGGSSTRNFVVFPGEEKKVKILERNGQKVPPQKIAQALEAAPQGGKVVGIRSRQIAEMANRINEAMGGGPQSLSDNVQREMKLATSVLQSKNPQAVEDWIKAYYNADLPMEQFEAATSNLRKTLPPETVDALIQNAGTFRTADQFKAFLNATPEERAKQLAKVSK